MVFVPSFAMIRHTRQVSLLFLINFLINLRMIKQFQKFAGSTLAVTEEPFYRRAVSAIHYFLGAYEQSSNCYYARLHQIELEYVLTYLMLRYSTSSERRLFHDTYLLANNNINQVGMYAGPAERLIG